MSSSNDAEFNVSSPLKAKPVAEVSGIDRVQESPVKTASNASKSPKLSPAVTPSPTVRLVKSANIAFIHPDLGIGGAERLVVDAAVGLQELNNKITIFTSHCDRSHCFEEVSSNLLQVKVYGDFLPTTFFNKFYILFAILRQLYLTIKLIVSGELSTFDYVIIDQLSFCVPLINLFSKHDCKILFYCHFPDQLLSVRKGWIKKLYRLPFDLIEEWTTGLSDKIVVNSNFTKSIFHKTFNRLSVEPGVIYPCVDITSTIDTESDAQVDGFFTKSPFFLSLNRFERKKNVELAVKALAKFRKIHYSGTKPILVIAGGYANNHRENQEYLSELESLCSSLELNHYVLRGGLKFPLPPSTDVCFLPSISTNLKASLIKKAKLLLYTPSFEHFGIVPVESMLYKTPVLAVNNGGPLESIVNFEKSNLEEATGYTEEPNHDDWAKIMAKHMDLAPEVTQKLGENGHRRVLKLFSREEMSLAFIKNLQEAKATSANSVVFGFLKFWRLEISMVIVSLLIYMYA
ncbi:glycosyltransferase family 4 protein [Suhomyces tanzawaensis NRRL Y-17324]|uniref:Alpha-1,3/1,6-mannosyltransferase ALG2 n=1 Tax=Suhomyces tanzawaensis NRRL Y-17324 TaxID=984487 RepID=A0A1E4SQZ0_9ASCO|nr:glycosyltransferase family 4 protein [Suhomyces tanzawaensis NRRL Y-17324]ODV81936.1 glycosyltransferase family 4 protein [Suhomyces tanzawaensis NRRL Y-17324]